MGTDRTTHPAPTFLVIGAMKSGTSTLAAQLDAHPDVHMGGGSKEIHFFDREYDRGEEWYLRQFDGAQPHQITFEATPNYMHARGASERILGFRDDLRFVAVLRDPVDRAYSHYWHEVERGREDLPFEQAVAAEPARLAAGDDDVWTHHSYLDRGLYLRQLRSFVPEYPSPRLHVALFDDLVADPERTYRDLLAFLGCRSVVPPDLAGIRHNSYVRHRSVLLRRVARSAGGVAGRLLGRLNVSRGRYPPLDDRVRRHLEDHFRPHNEALAAWLGRDLPWG